MVGCMSLIVQIIASKFYVERAAFFYFLLKPRKDDNEQLKYDLAVLFSLKFILTPKNGLPVGNIVALLVIMLGDNVDENLIRFNNNIS